MDYTWIWMPQWSGFWIFPLLCFAFMVIMMLMMFRHGACMPFGGRGRAAGKETPREILERRYASGELDKAQYDAMRRDLAA